MMKQNYERLASHVSQLIDQGEEVFTQEMMKQLSSQLANQVYNKRQKTDKEEESPSLKTE